MLMIVVTIVIAVFAVLASGRRRRWWRRYKLRYGLMPDAATGHHDRQPSMMLRVVIVTFP
jgi:hypothetical protein